MKKMFTKTIAIALIASTSVAMSGCYGPFALTSKLPDWNGQVSQKKFVNELVFLGLCILPAYELCVLGDGLIFNSIEFWGGNNPIAMKAGDVEESNILRDGQLYKVIKSRNSLTIAAHDSDMKVDFKYFPKEKAWYQMNGESKVKVVDMKDNTVFTYLPNNKTLAFDVNSINQIEEQVMAAAQ